MAEDTTKQNENSSLEDKAKLTDGERMVFQSLRNNVGQAKLEVYELNSRLELALKAMDAAEARFSGALILAANSRGFGGANLAEDFSRFILPPSAASGSK